MSAPRRPSLAQQSRELLLGRDLLRFATSGHRLRSLPRGDGGPVLLVPGYGAGDASLVLLRRLLLRLGHDARAAGLGRIGGNVPRQARRLGRAAGALQRETGRPVALVGQSLGGVLAREVAREVPQIVRRVITFGTPVVGGPAYTALAGRWSDADLARIRTAVEARDRVPIRVPITAIWSPNDGIVSPLACRDDSSPDVEHVEVRSTHLGMGVDPEVWRVVAERLAADP